MKNLILGLTGSVAAIKLPDLIAQLQPQYTVQIVSTQAADYFIKPYANELKKLDIIWFQDQDEWPLLEKEYSLEAPILHIELRRWADTLLIAPLDANTLAKITYGLCDNLLTSLVRAWDFKKPLVVCPAMNTLMWENALTAEQIAIIKKRGISIIDPVAKQLACKDIGMGGMASPEAIFYFLKNNI